MDPKEPPAQAPRQVPVSSQQLEPRYELADETTGPEGRSTTRFVYRRVPGGGLVVPTGRVFVRFAEGDSVERHHDDLVAAGYDIDEVPAYAPHAAWVRARSGDISDSLARLERLAEVPGVENVEPQMVGEVSRRD